MKCFSILAVLIASVVRLPAFERLDFGSLRVEGGCLIFRGTGEAGNYDLTNVPGLQLVSFHKRIDARDGIEHDESEATLAFASGQTFKLVGSESQYVIRVTDDSGIHWKLTDPPNPVDPLNREVDQGYLVNSFDDAVSIIEQRSGSKVLCPPEIASFLRKQWLHFGKGVEVESVDGELRPAPIQQGPRQVGVLRDFLTSICGEMGLKWGFDPKANTISLDLIWKTSDSRLPKELLGWVMKSDIAFSAKDAQWQGVFDALLCAPVNFEKAWRVRQQGILESHIQMLRFFAVTPVLIQSVVSTSQEKFILIVIEQPIEIYPGNGSMSYYWFREDGVLSGAGLCNTGHRCKLLNVTVQNGGDPSDILVVLEMNLRNIFLAYFQLTSEGLKLTSLLNARGESHENRGLNVGVSLLK